MRIGHFIHQLNPFGTERMLEALLRFRAPAFKDQFVVSYRDGPMRGVLETMGVTVWVTRDQGALSDRLATADVVNLHLLHPQTIPPCLSGRFARPKIITIQWMSAFPPGLADRFVATSRRAYDLQPDHSRCDLIPNGVDLTRFHGRRTATAGQQIICRVCRPEKCDESFWYAVLPVLTEYPNARIWLVGSEEQSTERVRAVGIVTDVVEYLAASSIFLYAPRPWEGSHDFVVMEAMAMGLPCVLTDVPTVTESVKNGDAAVLVPFGGAGAMAAALRRLLSDPEGAERLGQQARDHALSHFDVRHRVAEYEDVYLRALR